MATIKRKILFYKVEPEGLDLSSYLIQAGSFEGQDIYTDYFDETKRIFIDVADVNENSIQAKISYYRSTDFPRVAKDGTRTSYDLDLKADEGLSDTSHFIYFPAEGIIAFEFNFNAPRMTAIAYHLKAKTDIPPEFNLTPIMKASALEEIERLGSVKKVSLKVFRSSIDEVKYFDESLHQALTNAAKLGGSETIEITINSGRKKDSKLSWSPETLINKLKIFSKSETDPSYVFHKLKVSGDDERTRNTAEVDLLQQLLVSVVSVPKLGKGRDVSSESMFEELNKSFSTMKEKLSL